MNILMIAILSLILVFQISLFIVISAKDLTVDDKKEIKKDVIKDKRQADDLSDAERIKAEKRKRELEDYMRDIEALNKYGDEYNIEDYMRDIEALNKYGDKYKKQ